MADVRDISDLETFLATPACEVNDQIKLETVIKEEFEEIGSNISDLVKTEFVDVDQNCTNYEFKTEDMLENHELNCSASIPSKLSEISFLHAAHQYEKQYDVKFKPYSLHTSAKYYILTSDKDNNNTRAEWKLLVPVYNPSPISDVDMLDMTVEQHEDDQMVLRHSSSVLRVEYTKDLPSFMYAISSVHHVLIENQNFQRIGAKFENQYTNRLIPSFQYKKEKGTSGFHLGGFCGRLSASIKKKCNFFQVSTKFNQVLTNFSQVFTKFNQVLTNFSQVLTKFNQVFTNFNQVKPNLIKSLPNLIKF
jgi:hypothetical protein